MSSMSDRAIQNFTIDLSGSDDFNKYSKITYSTNKDNVLRLMTIGGIDQVPFLYNDETDEKIYESDNIIKYIEKNNG